MVRTSKFFKIASRELQNSIRLEFLLESNFVVSYLRERSKLDRSGCTKEDGIIPTCTRIKTFKK